MLLFKTSPLWISQGACLALDWPDLSQAVFFRKTSALTFFSRISPPPRPCVSVFSVTVCAIISVSACVCVHAEQRTSSSACYIHCQVCLAVMKIVHHQLIDQSCLKEYVCVCVFAETAYSFMQNRDWWRFAVRRILSYLLVIKIHLIKIIDSPTAQTSMLARLAAFANAS